MNNNSLLYGDSPLACAWLAASLEKKLSKQQYLKASIVQSTRAIERSSDFNSEEKPHLVSAEESDSQLQFSTQLAVTDGSKDTTNQDNEHVTLRISGQLLYGVVRIYSRKTRYLYDDASLALIQLKSAFAVSKSITVPIEETVLSSLDNITLKDKVTEANVLYDAEAFDINKVFGIQSLTQDSARSTQFWPNSENVEDDDYAMGDISIGRNNGHDTEFTTTMNSMNDFDIPDYNDVNNQGDNDEYDAANQSIDALARRAEVPMDDLDQVADFELPLDLNLKDGAENETALGDGGHVAGISDFQLSAIDNMDLEFTIDDTNNNDIAATGGANNTLLDVNATEEIAEDIAYNKQAGDKRQKRKSHKKHPTIRNMDVLRTQRKRLVLDSINEIPTDELKKNQREYPANLQSAENKTVDDTDEYNFIINSLQPVFLTAIGSSWKSIKRRKLLEGARSHIESLEESEIPGNIDHNIEDNVPNSPEIQEEFSKLSEQDEEVPEFNNDYTPIDNTLDMEGVDIEADVNEDMLPPNDDTGTDFDNNYDELKTKNKTTIEIAQELRRGFEDDDNKVIVFDDIVGECKLSNNKKSAATRAFFELLVLGTENTITLKQERLFGEIKIQSKAELFNKFL